MHQTLAARFGSKENADAFKAAFEDAVESTSDDGKEDEEEEKETNRHDDDDEKEDDNLSFSDKSNNDENGKINEDSRNRDISEQGDNVFKCAALLPGAQPCEFLAACERAMKEHLTHTHRTSKFMVHVYARVTDF